MSKYQEKCLVNVAPRMFEFETAFQNDLPPAVTWSIRGTFEAGEDVPAKEMRQAVEDVIAALMKAKEKKIVERMQEFQREVLGEEFSALCKKECRRD